MAQAPEVACCRRSERTITDEVVDHPWPQEVQQPRVAQQETPEPRVVQQVLVWPRVAQLGTLGPREAQQASSRPYRVEIVKGLPVRAEEPQVVQSPGEPPGRADRPPWW
jgi:hypothetical protein